ncbi:MAG: rhamnan synthesis F family protein [Syntrophobacteraceae bacterium]
MKKLLGLGSRNKKRPGAIGIDINIGPDDNPSNSMRGQAIKAPGAAHKKERGRAGGSAAEIESLGVELVESKRRAISWDQYDAAYEVWKRYKKQNIDRHEALQIIGDKYGVRAFFLLYPLYKIVRPFLKLKRSLENKISARKIIIGSRSIFDSSKKSILLISHDASQTGAPILAFNLMEKFAARYNVISVLLGSGKLKNAFTNLSFATIGPFEARTRLTRYIHSPILKACRRFEPAFAVVNSIESREALVPLAKAGVPSVLLVHEFISLWSGLDMGKVVAYAGQIVFSARLVWEDAVKVFPPLAARPANIITQGPCRIPTEWLGGKAANDERERIASVMRPLGPGDDAVVVIGCGFIHEGKGVDLFLAAAAALQRRSPSRCFRFVWVGPEDLYQPLYSRYLDAQVICCGLQETVKFLGEVNSLEPVYDMADIFLLSSRLDPFPNVAIDAMLAGLPVICFSNGSGVAEMLSNHVDLKRLVVPYADAASAAEVIEQLCNDGSYLQATKTAIRDLALSAFDMDRYVERLDQVADRASLIMRQAEEDAAAISRSDIFTMECAAPPGSRVPRDVCIKSFVRESAGFGGTRCPFPGFHPGIYRSAHPELNAPPFVNPLAHFIRSGEPKGPWLLDIITPVPSPSAQVPDQRAALHLHIHYPDLTPELFRPIAANQTRTDIFVTVSSDEGQREVTETAAGLGISIKDITVVPNRGRDVGPLLTLLGRRLVKDYDIIGHLHAKKSLSLPGRLKEGGSTKVGADWRSFCIENLLGGKHAMMDVILGRFARNLKLGLVFPCDPNTLGWTLNRPHAIALLERMGIVTELPQELFFPMGTMFWARTDAIAPLLEIDLAWSDYPFEPVAYDGTILHAIERLFPVVAQHRGFEIAGTYVPGVTR